MTNGRQILQALVTFSEPLDLLSQELSQLEWDYEGETVIFKPIHVVKVLNRFLSGELNVKDIEAWANMIECREDLEYEYSNHEQLEKVIYEFANPDIEGQLTIARCQKIFMVFSPPHSSERHYTQQIGLSLEWALSTFYCSNAPALEAKPIFNKEPTCLTK